MCVALIVLVVHNNHTHGFLSNAGVYGFMYRYMKLPLMLSIIRQTKAGFQLMRHLTADIIIMCPYIWNPGRLPICLVFHVRVLPANFDYFDCSLFPTQTKPGSHRRGCEAACPSSPQDTEPETDEHLGLASTKLNQQ